jgi:hypothetical protein
MIEKVLKQLFDLFNYEISKKIDFPVDFEALNKNIISKVLPYTMTSAERLNAAIEAVKYIVQNNIEGDIVECGVWMGGSSMAMMECLLSQKISDRKFYMYDTYEGMTEPDENDKAYTGISANEMIKKSDKTRSSSDWCKASLDIVKQNVSSTLYPFENICFVKGKVEDTIPENIPDKIAILRLDTDWYHSTLHEMKYLFPRLVKGGVLIIDDYGHWEGARKAIDEFIGQNQLKLFLSRIDYTCRVAIKTDNWPV